MFLKRVAVVSFVFFVASTASFAHVIGANSINDSFNKAPEIKVYTFNVGWYGRVFAGFSKTNLKFDRLSSPVVLNGDSWNDRATTKSAWVGGLAVGYRFNDLLRFDVSYAHQGKTKFKGNDYFASSAHTYNGDLKSNVFMVNGFVDLGTFKGITPFVGAGIGASSNRISNAKIEILNNIYDLDDNSKMNLAWAFHAGVGIQLNERTTFEIGYSYKDLGSAKTGKYANEGGNFKVKDVVAHDVTFGVRYAFH